MLSVTVLISRTLLFELNVTLTSIFNLTVLLSYRAIRMFLVQKFHPRRCRTRCWSAAHAVPLGTGEGTVHVRQEEM